jgi:hypothetical protein
MTLPAFFVDERQPPTDRAGDDEALSSTEQGAAEQENHHRRDRRFGQAQRQKVEQAGRRGGQKANDDAALGASLVGVASRPHARDERCAKLAAGNEADHEGTEAEPLMHMERQDREGEPDDEKDDQDHGHDRQQRPDDPACRLRPGRGDGHGNCRHCDASNAKSRRSTSLGRTCAA